MYITVNPTMQTKGLLKPISRDQLWLYSNVPVVSRACSFSCLQFLMPASMVMVDLDFPIHPAQRQYLLCTGEPKTVHSSLDVVWGSASVSLLGLFVWGNPE